MNGLDNKEAKKKFLSFTVSKDKFMEAMIFCSEEEKKECEKYLELKGIANHTVFANYIGLNDEGQVEYRKVSALYQYDKRLRNIIYKYISAFEERCRAYISNKYTTDHHALDKIPELKEKFEEGKNVPSAISGLTLFQLIDVIEKLPEKDKSDLFQDTAYLKPDLSALRELRNAISHNRIIFYYKLKPCIIDEKEDDSLRANLVNLYNLLDEHFKESYRKEVNDALKDDKISDFYELIPEKARIVI